MIDHLLGKTSALQQAGRSAVIDLRMDARSRAVSISFKQKVAQDPKRSSAQHLCDEYTPFAQGIACVKQRSWQIIDRIELTERDNKIIGRTCNGLCLIHMFEARTILA